MLMKGRNSCLSGCHCPGDQVDVRMHEELARPWVGVCVPFALIKFASPHFFEKKKDKRRRWCAAGQGMVFFFCPKHGIQFRASLAVLNSVHVLCSQNRVIKLKALSLTGSVFWEFFVLNRVRVSNSQQFTYTKYWSSTYPPPPPKPRQLAWISGRLLRVVFSSQQLEE